MHKTATVRTLIIKYHGKAVMTIEASKTYIFTKSGNEVRAIEPTAPYRGQPMWVVERTQGASAGKQMCVPARALVAALN